MGEILFEIVLQLLFEAVGEYLFEPLLRSVAARTTWNRLLFASAALALGFSLGWGSAVAYPHRLAPGTPITGLSLLIAPLATAAVMVGVGGWRFGRELPRPGLFSFWYAFDFAFGVALARFLRFA